MPDTVRFRFVEDHIGAFPIDRLCQVMNVSPRGLWAFRSRPGSRWRRMDMVVLAHIKEQSRLSLGSYVRPRMTEELKQVGVDVGHRRVGRVRRENGPPDCFLNLLTARKRSSWKEHGSLRWRRVKQ